MFNEDVLDFIKIKEELASHCSSIIAKEMALALEPMTNREKIQEALDETAEALRSWQTEIEQPLGGTRDIRESCKKSRKDFVLSREAIWDVYITIGAYKRMRSSLERNIWNIHYCLYGCKICRIWIVWNID